jgi:uncharacterized protein DUF6787
MFEKLKVKWKVKNNFQFVMILLVFSITGSIAVRIAGPVLTYFNVHRESMNPYIFWPIRILIIFPIYQFMLLIVGTLLGQFPFFWEFQKKTVGRMFRKK